MVQEIKVLRSAIMSHEREKAERATLKQQEKLIKAKVVNRTLKSSTPTLNRKCGEPLTEH